MHWVQVLDDETGWYPVLHSVQAVFEEHKLQLFPHEVQVLSVLR